MRISPVLVAGGGCCFSTLAKVDVGKPIITYSGADASVIAAIAWFAALDTSAIPHSDCSFQMSASSGSYSTDIIITHSEFGWTKTISLMNGWMTIAYIESYSDQTTCCGIPNVSNYLSYSDYYNYETWEYEVTTSSGTGEGIALINNRCEVSVCGDCNCISEDACDEAYEPPTTCADQCVDGGTEYTISKTADGGGLYKSADFNLVCGKKYCIERVSGTYWTGAGCHSNSTVGWWNQFYFHHPGYGAGGGATIGTGSQLAVNPPHDAEAPADAVNTGRICFYADPAYFGCSLGDPITCYVGAPANVGCGFGGPVPPNAGSSDWKMRICEVDTDTCGGNPLP